jgi:hypothetical protein
MAKKVEKPARKPPTTQAAAEDTSKKAESKPRTGAAAPAGAPVIDTSLAANAAAAMVANKVSGGTAAPKKESAAFKQLKAGLNKPSAGAMGGAFGIAGQQKKSNLPHHGGKQVGHNQTFGADVNRTGVPRRTPG